MAQKFLIEQHKDTHPCELHLSVLFYSSTAWPCHS
jgi:hypothetical protein